MRRPIATLIVLGLLLSAMCVAAVSAATPWAPNVPYRIGDQVTYSGVNYECIQAHTSLVGWEPPIVPALWRRLSGTNPTATPVRTATRTPTGPTATPTRTPTPPPSGSFVVSQAQFNQMFPNRNAFYTYNGLVTALSAYPAFAKTGDDVTRKREAAAFLANVSHETGGLVYIEEIAKGEYCASSAQYPCASGKRYYGRGPIQLSWNYNYGAAGQALGLPLLSNPDLVAQDASVAWRTGLWYWMTQNGPGTMTPHNAMVNGAGFGETIRSINGALECNGGNPAQVQSRINSYQSFTQILGVTPGNNLSC